MKRIIWYTIIVLLTLGGLVLLWQFRGAVVLFFLSLATAAVFRPGIEWLHSRGVPRIVAILITYILGLGTVIGLLAAFSGPVLAELQQLTNDFTSAYTRFLTAAPQGSQFERELASQLPPLENLLKGIAGNQGAALAGTLLGFASNLLDGLSQFIIVIVLSIYWSADEVHFERLWLSLLPGAQRTRARAIWRETEKGVGAYIRSELIQSILAALLLWLAYRLIGLPYPTLLALLGALVWLIPWMGALMAVIVPFLLGMMISVPLGIAAAAVTLLILGVMEGVVEPRFFNRKRYSSLFIILMIIALSDVYGLVGLLIAPPLAAAIQIFFSHILAQPSTEAAVDPATQLTNLRAELSRVEQMGPPEEDAPRVESLMERLRGLINRTEEAIKETR